MAERFDKNKERVSKGVRLTVLGIGLGFIVLVAVTLLDRWNESRYALAVSRTTAAPASNPTGGSFHSIMTEIDPPTEASVFNERIPLNDWEVRERFDREFYYNYQNADQLILWWKRSERYFPMIDKMLNEAGLPTDLKYLAVAESGLRNVKSPAQANGFWQFIPGTATRFGLRVDDQIDERLDPIKATKASIRYFQYMKGMLPTWTLVAAGYNMGEDNVKQAMAWQHQNNYWNLFLNEETMRYVFRIAAIKELLMHGDKYGLDFGRLKAGRVPQTKTMTVQGPIAALADWAQQQGYAYKDIKIFDPWIVGRALPTGSWNIDLPLTDEDRTTVSQP